MRALNMKIQFNFDLNESRVWYWITCKLQCKQMLCGQMHSVYWLVVERFPIKWSQSKIPGHGYKASVFIESQWCVPQWNGGGNCVLIQFRKQNTDTARTNEHVCSMYWIKIDLKPSLSNRLGE